MKNLKHWFFDLDGTLARTGEDIVVAWKGALKSLNLDLTRFDEVFKIGPTLEKLVYEMYPDIANQELVDELLARFKPQYDESGFPNTEPYAGVVEMLSALKSSGAKVYIVTNKRHNPTQAIVKKFHWDELMDGVWSYDTLDVKYKKPDLLARLIKELGVSPAEAVMVGDTKGDVDSGKFNAMTTIGVAWGYGSREEISDADYILDSAYDIANKLIK